MKAITVTVYVDDHVDLDDSSLDAIQSAASNEAYEQTLVWEAEHG
jgi:hypothetical protein